MGYGFRVWGLWFIWTTNPDNRGRNIETAFLRVPSCIYTIISQKLHILEFEGFGA